jgi:D-alanine---D-serine ligase
MKKTIVIIFGGNSSEYEVSLASAYAVLTHMPIIYECLCIGITKDGTWLLYDGDYKAIKEDTWMQGRVSKVIISPDPKKKEIIIFDTPIRYQKIDAILPILHGKNGEDGTVQAMGQIANIPLIGCDILSSALCMDKQRAHRIIASSNIKVPHSFVINQQTTKEEIQTKIIPLGFPIFIKPLKAGSSMGITKVMNMDRVLPAIKKAFQYDDNVIIEENIDGFEVGCAIIGTHNLFVGDVDEIEIQDGFFDYTEKYTLQSSHIHLPARIPLELKEKIQTTAKQIYQTLGCQVFARVDMFITFNQEIVFNEVNTIPGFTTHSRFPNMIKATGLSFSEMLERILQEGLSHANHTTI